MRKRLFVLVGPTGVGKTDLSIKLAQALKTEIISADSRQVFKELSIGTAVPDLDQLTTIKHHFIQCRSIYAPYNASKYEQEALPLIAMLHQTNNNLLLVGGSGMYIDAVHRGIDIMPDIEPELRTSLSARLKREGIEALRFELKKLDPEYYATVDLKNPMRILKGLEVSLQTGKPYSSFLKQREKQRAFETVFIGLNRDREELHQRINMRVDNMMEQGLLDEALPLLKDRSLTSLNTVGYRELFDYFENNHSLSDATELIKRNTRRYARKQITWFNRGGHVSWFHADDEQNILSFVEAKLKQ